MSLVSKVLSGLFNGISQQTPDIRLESQGELQENAVSSLVYGLGKRPSTELLAVLGTSGISTNVFMHSIIRDGAEQYIVVIDDDEVNPIRVFTLDGTPCTVVLDASAAYLESTDLRKNLRATTVADYTFISNAEKTVAFTADVSGPSDWDSVAVVTIKSGVASQTYEINIEGGVKATYTAGDSSQYSTYKTTTIASALAAQLSTNLGAGWEVLTKGSSIKIRKVDGSNFPIFTTDSWANQAMRCSKMGVPGVTFLPSECWDGIVFKVEPTGGGSASYYKFFSDGDKQTGVWTETAKPGINYKLDPATMPHALLRTGVNTFTFKQLPWEDRKVGDEDSAPSPSFVGGKINDVFMYRNRLGFLSGENGILSKASDYFNFFASTVLDTLDDDPIDFAVSADDVNILRHAITFQESLIVTSDRTQFQVASGDGPLTPGSINISTTTRFETDPECRPVGIGPNLYFTVPRAGYSSVREYFVQPDTLINDAADVTAHCPKYLPPRMKKLVASTNLDVLFCQPLSDLRSLYIYNFYWTGDEKQQSAWHKWSFDGDVLDVSVVGSWLYLLMLKGSALLLERINLEYVATGSLPFTVHLDHLTSLQGTYDAQQDRTTWTLPFTDDGVYGIVDPDSGLSLDQVTHSGVYLYAPGDWSAKEYLVGRNYTMRYRFSEWSVKAPNTNVANLQGRLMSRTITLSFQNTGFFKVEVTPFDRETFTYEFSATQLGYINLEAPALMSDTERFPCMGAAKNLRVDIVNDSYLPSWFTTAAWEGFYVKRSALI